MTIARITLRCDSPGHRCTATFDTLASDVRIARNQAAAEGWTICRMRNVPVLDLCPGHSATGT